MEAMQQGKNQIYQSIPRLMPIIQKEFNKTTIIPAGQEQIIKRFFYRRLMREIFMPNKVMCNLLELITFWFLADMTMDQIDELLKKANFISKQQEKMKLPQINQMYSSKSPKAYRAPPSRLNVTQQYKISQFSPKKGALD